MLVKIKICVMKNKIPLPYPNLIPHLRVHHINDL